MTDRPDSSSRAPGPAFAGVRSIARNTTLLAATQVISIATRAAYVVLVARLLGPELYALLAYSQAWCLAFLPLALYGRGIVVHTIAREPHRSAGIVAQVIGIRVTFTALACMACAALAWLLPGNRDVAPLISVLLLALVGRSLAGLAQDLFRAFEVTHHTLRQEATCRVIELVVAAAILLSGGGLIWLLASHSLVWCVQAAWSLRVVRRDLAPLRLAWRPAEWLPAARTARPFFIVSLAAAWCQDGPLVLYRHLADNDVLFGQFALALQMLMVPAGLSQALAAAAQPVITRSAQRGDGKDLVYAGTVLRLAFLAGALLGLAGLGIGPWLFATLFGARFAVAGELVGPALFCLVPMLAGIGLPAVIMARGHFRAGTLAIVASAAVMTALMLLLVPRFGVYGAIGALFLGHIAAPLIASAYATRRGWHLVQGAVTRPIAAIAIAALTWAAMAFAGTPRWLATLAAIVALLASAGRLGVMTRDEREFLTAAWRERRA